jgi:hypothetical protein
MFAHCDIQIRELAKAAAGHRYERLIGDDCFYETWRRQNPDASPHELERRSVEKNVLDADLVKQHRPCRLCSVQLRRQHSRKRLATS